MGVQIILVLQLVQHRVGRGAHVGVRSVFVVVIDNLEQILNLLHAQYVCVCQSTLAFCNETLAEAAHQLIQRGQLQSAVRVSLPLVLVQLYLTVEILADKVEDLGKHILDLRGQVVQTQFTVAQTGDHQHNGVQGFLAVLLVELVDDDPGIVSGFGTDNAHQVLTATRLLDIEIDTQRDPLGQGLCQGLHNRIVALCQECAHQVGKRDGRYGTHTVQLALDGIGFYQFDIDLFEVERIEQYVVAGRGTLALCGSRHLARACRQKTAFDSVSYQGGKLAIVEVDTHHDTGLVEVYVADSNLCRQVVDRVLLQ